MTLLHCPCSGRCWRAVGLAATIAGTIFSRSAAEPPATPTDRPAQGIRPLAAESVTLFASPDPTRLFVGELAPALMRGRLDADLTRRDSWTFASAVSFRDVLPNVETDPGIDFFGVPFFAAPYPVGSNPAAGRNAAPIGWLEANVVQFTDPNHLWYDPAGKTFHLWMRANTGGTGYAAIAKVVEQGDKPGTGAMTTTAGKGALRQNDAVCPLPGRADEVSPALRRAHQALLAPLNSGHRQHDQARAAASRPLQPPQQRAAAVATPLLKNLVDW